MKMPNDNGNANRKRKMRGNHRHGNGKWTSTLIIGMPTKKMEMQ